MRVCARFCSKFPGYSRSQHATRMRLQIQCTNARGEWRCAVSSSGNVAQVWQCEQCGPGFALVELIEHAEARATHSHHSWCSGLRQASDLLTHAFDDGSSQTTLGSQSKQRYLCIRLVCAAIMTDCGCWGVPRTSFFLSRSLIS